MRFISFEELEEFDRIISNNKKRIISFVVALVIALAIWSYPLGISPQAHAVLLAPS